MEVERWRWVDHATPGIELASSTDELLATNILQEDQRTGKYIPVQIYSAKGFSKIASSVGLTQYEKKKTYPSRLGDAGPCINESPTDHILDNDTTCDS